MEIGKRLKDMRTGMGMTQEECAEKLGVARQTLSSWESGRTFPDIRSVDLRAFAMPGTTGLRIRYAGQSYDPFEDTESDMDFLMGINT